MTDFAVSVKKWVEQAKGRQAEAFIGIALAAEKRLKELTPVKSGYLRANWVATLDPDIRPREGGNTSIQLNSSMLNGQVIYIVNPVQYARRIEYGFVGTDALGRYYNQPGRGMMQQTIKELPQIARQVVAEVRGK
jgi:hypothetical protein